MPRNKDNQPCFADCRFGIQRHEKHRTFLCRRRAPQRVDLDFIFAALLRSIAASQLTISKREQEWFDQAMDPKIDCPPIWPTVEPWDWCRRYEDVWQ